jgi:hypothetical protein
VLVSATAIQRRGQVATVYVVHDGIATLRLVQSGAESPEGVEVLAGLEAGESVVTSPPARLVDGARVAVGTPSRAGGTP